MNLVFTATAYPPSTGGAQLHTHRLVQALSKRHPTHVITFWDRNRTDWLLGTTLLAPTFPTEYRIDDIPVHRLGFSVNEKLGMLPYVLGYYAHMEEASRRLAATVEAALTLTTRKANLIHNVRIGREPITLASQQRARALGIPFVFTPLHHPRWRGWPYQVFERVYRTADGLIALTQSEKSTLIEMGIAADRISVTGIGPLLSPSADPDAFQRAHSLRGPVVLFVGQHYAYKGYRQLLQAAPLVWERVPDAHFVFIGPDVGDSKHVFREYPDPRIRRLGPVSLQAKTDAMAACALLCVPSTQESFGGVYTEAWSSAKPVIGCPIPAVSEVITEGVDGYLVEPRPPEIAERIIHLLLNPGLADGLGRAGLRKVNERYTWSRIAELTEAAYLALT